MRIQTSGKYEYRTDLYGETADPLGENTRSKREMRQRRKYLRGR